MKYRNQKEGGDLFAFIEHRKKAKATQRRTVVGRLRRSSNGRAFRSDLEDILGYVTRVDGEGGRLPFDRVIMFKVLVLQKFHGPSDASVEEQIADGFSFLESLKC
jgi:hypothetical protein